MYVWRICRIPPVGGVSPALSMAWQWSAALSAWRICQCEAWGGEGGERGEGEREGRGEGERGGKGREGEEGRGRERREG